MGQHKPLLIFSPTRATLFGLVSHTSPSGPQISRLLDIRAKISHSLSRVVIMPHMATATAILPS